MSVRRRLEALETRFPALKQSSDARSGPRRRMKKHLDHLTELRRGGATVENNAELAAMSEAVERRRQELRGEGAIADG